MPKADALTGRLMRAPLLLLLLERPPPADAAALAGLRRPPLPPPRPAALPTLALAGLAPRLVALFSFFCLFGPRRYVLRALTRESCWSLITLAACMAARVAASTLLPARNLRRGPNCC